MRSLEGLATEWNLDRSENAEPAEGKNVSNKKQAGAKLSSMSFISIMSAKTFADEKQIC